MARSRIVLYAGTIFLSAFLLFQVQPIIAKSILPWFGGSAAVWTTCMLFFQIVLLAGYGYAYLTMKLLGPRQQAMLHIALLAASVATLPILPNPAWKPAGFQDPITRILGLLGMTLGAPYFLLSSTGPLLQAWFVREADPAASRRTYRLFALSNLGSMLALLSYPPLVEPFLGTRFQAHAWSAAYVIFVITCATVAWRASGVQHLRKSAAETVEAPRPSRWLLPLWTALAACASILLLAVTNYLCQEVASIPFLWIVPLTLYLLSFILCFDSDRWYRRFIFLPLAAVALGGLAYRSKSDAPYDNLQLAIVGIAGGLFVCCMVCHGELARLKPHPRYLTSFYLATALGGAIGGIFVGVFAPLAFRSFFEVPVGLAFCAALIVVVLHVDPASPFYKARHRLASAVLAVAFIAFAVYTAYEPPHKDVIVRLRDRNFYGRVLVVDSGVGLNSIRTFVSGSTNHGGQFLDETRRRWPTTYFSPRSGVGMVLARGDRGGARKIGIVGLGAGTLASYGRKGDLFRFYELNPSVALLAYNAFAFLRDTPASLDVTLGDGRLNLEREPPQNYDVLILDAFSSDAVPVHLLTREAFEVYFRHLKPDGILAVNVTNHYLNLTPVVHLAASAWNKEAVRITNEEDPMIGALHSLWILIASDMKHFPESMRPAALATMKRKSTSAVRIWTDDYSNMYQILK